MSRISSCRSKSHVIPKVALCAFMALSVGSPGLLHAEDAAPTVEEIRAAEEAFTAGREAFKNGSFTEAAEHFERADLNAPNDRVLELAISSRDKAGQADRAATLAQLGIDRYPESERLKKLAEPIIDKAKKEQLVVTVECDEPCSLLDGTRIIHGEALSSRLIYLAPGKHTLRATWSEGRSESKPVEGKAGDAQTVTFEAPEIPEEPEEPAPGPAPAEPVDRGPAEPPSGLDPLYFWIGAGVTAAVGGVTIWSGLDTMNNPGKDAVEEACSAGRPDCQDLYDEGNGKELRTNILIAGTGVAAITTAVLGIFTNWSGSSEAKGAGVRRAAKVEPFVDVGSGAMFGAKGRF